MKQARKIKIFMLFLLTTCAFGSIRRVPSEYPTIQSAINDANDHDTVLVAPGTYTGEGNRDILYKGKVITVKSEGGPESCIIDCQGTPEEPHRGFYFGRRYCNDANSILQGFTIINGYEIVGGGIFCAGADQLIIECIIKDNAAIDGGGIVCMGLNLALINCIFSNNTAETGGGISISGDKTAFTNCFVTGNKATTGGGVSISGSESTFTNCFINGNKATTGGGVSISGGESTFTNCFINGNNAANNGSGIYCIGIIELLNCTISDNWAGKEGGGLYLTGNGKINNSILYGNMASIGSELYPYFVAGHAGCPDYAIVNITHSVVGNDPNAIATTDCPNLVSGQWLQVDPLFSNPGYWGPNGTSEDPNDDFWVDGDYHLKSQAGRFNPNSGSWVIDDVTSPCIDTGDPNSSIGDEPFPNGGIINMGAYGGTAEASKSYFGEPLCETVISGDINGDCKVDLKDFVLLAAHWLEQK